MALLRLLHFYEECCSEIKHVERLEQHNKLSKFCSNHCCCSCHLDPLQCSCLENPRDGEPGGLPSMGSHRVGHN